MQEEKDNRILILFEACSLVMRLRCSEGGREVLDQAVMFYCDYLDWEDRNIVDDDTSKFH